jgi:putative endonuclease
MMSNKKRTVLYTGVTNDLHLRVAQHRSGKIPGFTRDYHCIALVYCSHFREIEQAITWEKQLKGWRRRTGSVRLDSANRIARSTATLIRRTNTLIGAPG